MNPILEVTPITALTEMVSQFVLRPLNVLGQHLGNFYANLLEPLPWVWKLPVLLVATTIIVIVILIAFRYKLNFGFNLFCLEPTSQKSLSQSEEPKKDNERKTEDSIKGWSLKKWNGFRGCNSRSRAATAKQLHSAKSS